MTRIRVLPYKQGSKSAKALADALGGRVLKLVGSTFQPRSTDLVLCWGKADPSHPALVRFMNTNHFARVLNDPEDVVNASNKLEFFQSVPPELVPPFWTTASDIPDDAFPVVCRTVLSGHSGEGIVIANSRDELVPCQLYVKYVKKKDEYRVHIGRRGEDFEVIAVQRKARRSGETNVNWQVRNLANGFVFVRGGFNPPEAVSTAAIEGLRATSLDFGAVDVIWNAQQQRAYVLEVNTAPGLEGQTVVDYANYFRSIM